MFKKSLSCTVALCLLSFSPALTKEIPAGQVIVVKAIGKNYKHQQFAGGLLFRIHNQNTSYTVDGSDVGTPNYLTVLLAAKSLGKWVVIDTVGSPNQYRDQQIRSISIVD